MRNPCNSPSTMFGIEQTDVETRAYAKVRQLCAAIAVEALPISRQGDGNCGNIIDLLKEALQAASLYVDPSTVVRAGYRKTPIKPSLRRKVFERDGYRCKKCNDHLDLCADHVIPESAGGLAELDNLQTLCRPCNSKKGVRQ